ncbi:MAG: fatty acid kinase fatty acid binding subunit, partial [Solirubrobacteraceae bacterium]|nr:fatty acid kinase fatty acid binding subunit [Solirubrobacteraceae bacterium]
MVRVVTDTTHYLPRELVAAHGIELVSLYVNWNGRTDRESAFEDFGEYYDYLGTAKDQPTTSQPSDGDYIEVYQPIADAGDDIVSQHLSGGISGT